MIENVIRALTGSRRLKAVPALMAGLVAGLSTIVLASGAMAGEGRKGRGHYHAPPAGYVVAPGYYYYAPPPRPPKVKYYYAPPVAYAPAPVMMYGPPAYYAPVQPPGVNLNVNIPLR